MDLGHVCLLCVCCGKRGGNRTEDKKLIATSVSSSFPEIAQTAAGRRRGRDPRPGDRIDSPSVLRLFEGACWPFIYSSTELIRSLSSTAFKRRAFV